MYLIKDNMRKECKYFLVIAMVCFLLSALPLLVGALNIIVLNRDFMKISLLFVVSGAASFLIWLSAMRYELLITQDRVTVRTMFMKHAIDLCDVTSYTCKKYNKSVFYQFELFTTNKRIMVSTRYQAEFVAVLQSANIAKKKA